MMTAQRWKLLSLILLVAFISLFAYSYVTRRPGANLSADTVVLQVQKMSQLVSVRYRIQRVVSLTEQKQPVGQESILLMVEGDVQAGIDLQKISASSVTTDDEGNIQLTLPPPAIFNASLDESKTKVWDRTVTWWTPWVSPDPDLEHKARLQALDDIRKAAIDMGIVRQAQTNAQGALGDLFNALGWKITVKATAQD